MKTIKIAAFFSRYILTNLLALFLVGLSVAEGNDAVQQFPAAGIHLDTSELDYIDFPTSVSRGQYGKQHPREMMLPLFYLKDNPLRLLQFLHTSLPEVFSPFSTPGQIRQIVSLIVWCNAP
ncbi:hypothetical protein [Cyclobacterium plantarum]|uniref:Uncharacterized protein n=1 Tax=Cyclobacterium plantarum TaxID=2716263 RepID=A0ABX0HCQ2_9BACT|nr:hypothetical protein [Cyclobacterium plantarum]NHE59669.1 hypothetical protein [Cyclobacterium plantarum]